LEHPLAIVIDYQGNDAYINQAEGPAQGVGRMGVGLLIDLGGKDGYESKNISQGVGILGLGAIYDADGEDHYRLEALGQGAGVFGLGLIIDKSGSDRYQGSLMCQGFGGAGGFGLLADGSSWDVYRAGFQHPDHRDQTISTLSLSQGFAYGLRPGPDNPVGLSGGVGALVDAEGSDVYIGDYFGQGAAYYFGLGLLYDYRGDDAYRAGRYAHGAGVHYAAGLLLDRGGNDTYHCYYGVGISLGHDYGVGLLYDQAGDDAYFGGVLTQAAGNANGFGFLFDSDGNDQYTARLHEEAIAVGTYNQQRKNGSIGILMDLGNGRDCYADPGLKNNYSGLKKGTQWGLFIDE
jgi:hypothetical protein